MARIPPAELERLKREVSLVRLVQSQGHELTKRGKDWGHALCVPRREHAEPVDLAREEPVSLIWLRGGGGGAGLGEEDPGRFAAARGAAAAQRCAAGQYREGSCSLQLAAPKVASGPFYAATEHHLGVTCWEAAPRLGLDAWTTKSASGDTVGAKATGATEVPATSATARLVLREDLAAQAGIPRICWKLWRMFGGNPLKFSSRSRWRVPSLHMFRRKLEHRVTRRCTKLKVAQLLLRSALK